MTKPIHGGNGQFVSPTFEAIYAEIKRIDQLREADQRAVVAALISAEKAVDKANDAQQRVNETQNEFRGTLADQARTLMPRTETENLVRELRDLIIAQGTAVSDVRSRVDMGPPNLPGLQARVDTQTGASMAIQQGWKYVLAVGSILVGLAGLLVVFVEK